MPSIKRVERKETFVKYAEELQALGDNNFCAPISVAIATGVDVKIVREIMENFGRKNGRGTFMHITEKTLRELGFRMIRVNHLDLIKKFPKPHCDVLKNFTTHHPRRFPGCVDPNKVYLVRTNTHVLCVREGEVHDWSINRSLRAITIHEIVKA